MNDTNDTTMIGMNARARALVNELVIAARRDPADAFLAEELLEDVARYAAAAGKRVAAMDGQGVDGAPTAGPPWPPFVPPRAPGVGYSHE